MRIVDRLLALTSVGLIAAVTAMHAQVVKPTATLSGSTPVAYKFPPPATLSAVQSGPGAVRLSWSAVGGASSYVVTGPAVTAPGMTVTATAATISGVQGPGMVTFSVAAATTMGTGTVVGAPGTQTTWVKGTTPGLVKPNLSSPSFQIWLIAKNEGALNDAKGIVVKMSLALTQNPPSCPYTPMFYYDGAQPPISAAGNKIIDATGQVEPDSDPASEKYPIVIGGNIQFRAPIFPGLRYVQSPATNAWVFIVDCHNQYSNALAFRVYPPDFQLLSAHAMKCQDHHWVYSWALAGTGGSQTIPATQPGQQVDLAGTGFAGGSPPGDQKVYFHLQGTDANGKAIAGDAEASLPFTTTLTRFDERQISVLSPDPGTLGLYNVEQATVYVTRSGKQSASLPISYYPTSTGAPVNPASC